jgi:type I restriction enzyme S subunit
MSVARATGLRSSSPGTDSLVRLGDLVERVERIDPRRVHTGLFTYIDVSSVSNETLTIVDSKRIAANAAPSRARNPVKAGDVLFATVRPGLKRIALVPSNLDGAVASTGYCVLRPRRDVLDSQYLFYSCITPQFVAGVTRLQKGSSYPAVRDADVLQQNIVLPSLAEQVRIATILAAISRAITAHRDWVKRLRTVKASLLEQEFQSDVATTTRQLTELASIQTGLAKGRRLVGVTVELPYLRVANVQDGRLDLREVKTIEVSPSEIERFRLRSGDVLLTEGGDDDKLGRGYIWRGQIDPCLHQNHVFAVRANPEMLLPEFLSYFLQTSGAKGYFATVAHRTTNLASINTVKLGGLPVPALTIDEQTSAVHNLAAIDRALDGADQYLGVLLQMFDSTLAALIGSKK